MRRAFAFLPLLFLLGCSLTVRETPGESGRLTGRLVALEQGSHGIEGRATSTDRLTFPKRVKYRVSGLPPEWLAQASRNPRRVYSSLYILKEKRGEGDWSVTVQLYSD